MDDTKPMTLIERLPTADDLADFKKCCKCTEDHQEYESCNGDICIAQRDAIADALPGVERTVKALRNIRGYIKDCDHEPAVDEIDALIALIEQPGEKS
jgi:hypothetical protein